MINVGYIQYGLLEDWSDTCMTDLGLSKKLRGDPNVVAMACSTFFPSQVIEDNWSECQNPGSYGYTWLYPNGVAKIVSLLWLA